MTQQCVRVHVCGGGAGERPSTYFPLLFDKRGMWHMCTFSVSFSPHPTLVYLLFVNESVDQGLILNDIGMEQALDKLLDTFLKPVGQQRAGPIQSSPSPSPLPSSPHFPLPTPCYLPLRDIYICQACPPPHRRSLGVLWCAVVCCVLWCAVVCCVLCAVCCVLCAVLCGAPPHSSSWALMLSTLIPATFEARGASPPPPHTALHSSLPPLL
jgi:hypothetical protein